ncbi:MAG TPA: hypothetical protein QGF95_12640 [Candidatus Latescibacteria bacterium]|jgi:hypothetical protein|nr:hypothetical protein [Gemmatimonadaceae bacterium]MDP6014460.1 hypothetical protein [Candidatus Latescibacterota bacterium]HJP31390.1 hypothetical protein [Candidatus Latescibacterota bacterium]
MGLLKGAALYLLLLAGSLEAQAGARTDTASAPVSEAAKPMSPRGALWRSTLIPGWGQATTGHPVKAVLFAGAGAGLLSAAVIEGARVGEAPTALTRQDRAARRNTRVLYYVIAATLSGLDAYVDAHLADFAIDADPFAMAGVRFTVRF